MLIKTKNQINKQRKPIIERIVKRYENAHIKDCNNCKKDEKSCIFYGYITNKDKCVYFEKRSLKV